MSPIADAPHQSECLSVTGYEPPCALPSDDFSTVRSSWLLPARGLRISPARREDRLQVMLAAFE